jgi:hypothetical protein
MFSSEKPYVAASLLFVSILFLGTPMAKADWMTPVAIYDHSPERNAAEGAANMIDGDLATYSKQSDDINTDVEPITGYVVFDLGQKMNVGGFEFWSRDVAVAVNAKNVDFFYWNNEDVNAHVFSPNTSDQVALDTNVVIAANKDLPGVMSGAMSELAFSQSERFAARYVGMRYNTSWDTPPGAWTSFAEIKLDTSPIPEPGAITLLITGLIGLLAYAWRKRK